MWIDRKDRKQRFLKILSKLKNEVLVVRGARQVGKTSFVQNAIMELKNSEICFINAAVPRKRMIQSREYYGRDYIGINTDASELLKNIEFTYGELDKRSTPLIVFIDEVDRFPIILEMIQELAGLSSKLKVILTGSNLENIQADNAATGRKRYFDLYPITFIEYLNAIGKEREVNFLHEVTPDTEISDFIHNELSELFDNYMRVGGMPRILDLFISGEVKEIPETIASLATTIEENVKAVLGEKSSLYEYEDVLRNLALASLDTLKFSRLQVNHAGRGEAKRLVNKTTGARVAHKIRLFNMEKDLSKYIIFDVGILNYLLNGSYLTQQAISTNRLAIMYESIAGQELIAALKTRDELLYWKSPRGAQVEFTLNHPILAGIDVKSTRGDTKSLASFAVLEEDASALIKVSSEPLKIYLSYEARVPNIDKSRKCPLLHIPHYMSFRIPALLNNLSKKL
ncbi:MAG: AAA family ATPase [Planctomycetota bacterium]